MNGSLTPAQEQFLERTDQYTSVLQTLKARKNKLEEQLTVVNKALDELNSHPEVTSVLEAMYKALRV